MTHYNIKVDREDATPENPNPLKLNYQYGARGTISFDDDPYIKFRWLLYAKFIPGEYDRKYQPKWPAEIITIPACNGWTNRKDAADIRKAIGEAVFEAYTNESLIREVATCPLETGASHSHSQAVEGEACLTPP